MGIAIPTQYEMRIHAEEQLRKLGVDPTHSDGEKVIKHLVSYIYGNNLQLMSLHLTPDLKVQASTKSYMDQRQYTVTINPRALSCSHSVKIYDSGFTRYEYCERCNEKLS